MEKMEALQKIEENVKALYEENQDEFDAIGSAFSILTQGVNLLAKRFGEEKLKAWAAEDAPEFYRFGSVMKSFLEAQNAYLHSMEATLIVDGDVVSKKIETAKQAIRDIAAKEGLILKEGKPLFDVEEALRSRTAAYDALQIRMKKLQEMEEMLQSIDVEAMGRDIADRETIAGSLDQEVQELTRKGADLEEKYGTLKEAREGLDGNVQSLESAYGEQALALSKSLPLWIQKIGEIKALREEKDRKYLKNLEEEAETLKQIENDLQERLLKMNETMEKAAEYQDVLRKHFDADKALGASFSQSLGEINERIQPMSDSIERELENFDRRLHEMQQRVQGMANDVQRIGLGR